MIDEKKLIGFINSKEFQMRIVRSQKSVQEILCEFIEEQPKIGGWIPCSERFPKKSGEYVVMITGAELPTCLHFLNSDKSWFDMEKEYKVSYWQPLPEPYHG